MTFNNTANDTVTNKYTEKIYIQEGIWFDGLLD